MLAAAVELLAPEAVDGKVALIVAVVAVEVVGGLCG